MHAIFIASLFLYGFLFFGYLIRRLKPGIEARGKTITRCVILFLDAPTVFLSFWSQNPTDIKNGILLPVIQVMLIIFSGICGYFIAIFFRKSRQFTGTFTMASGFSNNGLTLGGFLCFLFLGEPGFNTSVIFTLFFMPFFFSAGLVTARSFAPGREKMGILAAIRENFKDPVSVLPVLLTFLGVIICFLRVPYPVQLTPVRNVMVYAGVSGYAFSFGVGMHIRRMIAAWPAYLGMLPVKFIITPLIAFGLCQIFGFTLAAHPVEFKTLMIQSAMPCAIFSVVASKLFDLDTDTALSLWLLTTLSVAVELPFFLYLSHL
jgi:malate permease and related proteins